MITLASTTTQAPPVNTGILIAIIVGIAIGFFLGKRFR